MPPRPPRPPAPNTPPRIIGQTPLDPRLTFYRSLDCLEFNPQFTLTVDEMDATDSLSSLWFVDESSTAQPFLPPILPPSSLTQRSVSQPLSLNFKNALANLPIGLHALTAYVADGVFDEVVDQRINATRFESLADGGSEAVQASIVTVNWALDVAQCP